MRACARQQLLRVYRLGDEVGGAAGEGAVARDVVVGAGDDDNRHAAHALGVGGANAADERVAVEPRHLDVRHHQFDVFVLHQLLPASLAVLGLDQVELAAQDFAHGLADDARVIDDQDPDPVALLFHAGYGCLGRHCVC